MGLKRMFVNSIILAFVLAVYELFARQLYYNYIQRVTGSRPNILHSVLGYFLVMVAISVFTWVLGRGLDREVEIRDEGG